MAGQSVFQLAVMYALVFHGDALFGVPPAAAVQGPSVHYTLVFNAFVMMQLFNQARRPASGLACMLRGAVCTFACMHALWASPPSPCTDPIRHACRGTCTVQRLPGMQARMQSVRVPASSHA